MSPLEFSHPHRMANENCELSKCHCRDEFGAIVKLVNVKFDLNWQKKKRRKKNRMCCSDVVSAFRNPTFAAKPLIPYSKGVANVTQIGC